MSISIIFTFVQTIKIFYRMLQFYPYNEFCSFLLVYIHDSGATLRHIWLCVRLSFILRFSDVF